MVALLFTDIEGSTRLLERAPAAYLKALEQHHAILRRILAENGGEEFQDGGDGLFLAFRTPEDGARAALKMQAALAAASWPEETGRPSVRLALHWAEAPFREGQYRGPAVHGAARLLSAAHGGQILCSDAAAEAIEGSLPVRRLGAYRLRGFEKTMEVYQLNTELEFPPLRAEQARKHNLPGGQNAFIGREAELEELVSRLAPAMPTRVVALTGPGGIGKSRLSLACGWRLLEPYEHAVLFVPLVDVLDAASIPSAILEAAGARPDNTQDPLRQLAGLLAEVPILIILDNFEQFAVEGGSLIVTLCRELPKARFLISSRVRLAIPAEQEIPVRPLGIPAEDVTTPEEIGSYASVKLLLDRAVKARPGFKPSSENLREAAALCRILDGMPLAIELAAAKLQVLTLRQLCDTLSGSDEVPGGTMGFESVFEWSVRLLPPEIANFLGDLSVFRGGWTAQAAAEIGGLPEGPLALGYLHYLLTCSLIHSTERTHGMRFSMLEPIRQLAGKDRDSSEAIKRHAAYFFRQAGRVAADFGTAREEALVKEIDPEAPNILAALEREPSNQQRIYSAIDFLKYAMHRSCNRRVRALLTDVRPEGGEVLERTMARAWSEAGTLDFMARDFKAAMSAYEKSLELLERRGETENAMKARYNIANIATETGQFEQAFEVYDQILTFFRERQAWRECSVILVAQGSLAFRMERFGEAKALADECLDLAAKVENQGIRGYALSLLGEVAIKRGDGLIAGASLAESLEIACRLGEATRYPEMLLLLGRLAIAQGDLESAAFFAGASEKCATRTAISENVSRDLAQLISRCEEIGGDTEFHQNAARGARADQPEWLRMAEKLKDRQFFLQVSKVGANNA